MKISKTLLTISSAALLAAACGGGTTPASDESSQKPTPSTSGSTTRPSETPSTVPPTSAQPTTPSAPASPTGKLTSTRVYFLRGEKVVSVHRDVSVVSGAVATATMHALLAGPTAAEKSAGVVTTIPTATRLRGITIANGTADVDLTSAYVSGGGTLSMTARLMQVVYTLTQFPTVQRVTFRIDGKPTTVFGGEGIVLGKPATRADFESFLPAIFIDSPAMGETVSSPVVVRGVANVFEGQFLVEVTDSTGKVLVRAPAHASMGMYTAFVNTLRFTVPTPGAGRVTGFDYSPKDGSRILDYVVPVTVR